MELYAISYGWTEKEIADRVRDFLNAGFIPADKTPNAVLSAKPDITLHFVLSQNVPQ
jgi:hypothetical protein